MAQITAKPFRLALLQLGPMTSTKALNIDIARKAVTAAANSTPKPHLIVLPEIWNSPYAVSSFREYSERVPDVRADGSQGEVEGEGETVKALREMARSTGCWLIGGELLWLGAARQVWSGQNADQDPVCWSSGDMRP